MSMANIKLPLQVKSVWSRYMPSLLGAFLCWHIAFIRPLRVAENEIEKKKIGLTNHFSGLDEARRPYGVVLGPAAEFSVVRVRK